MEYPKEELKILAKANSEFFKRYFVSIIAGFGGSVYFLKLRKIPLNSTRGYLTIFGSGLFGEYFGRVWGNRAQNRVTAQLPRDSYLQRLKRGELEVSVGMDQQTKQLKVKLFPKGELDKQSSGLGNGIPETRVKSEQNTVDSSSSPLSNKPSYPTVSNNNQFPQQNQKIRLNKYGDEIIETE